MELLLALLISAASVAITISRWHNSATLLKPLSIAQTIDRLLAPYLGARLTPEELAALEARAHEAFVDAMTEHRLLVGTWRVKLLLDELLGPTCRLVNAEGLHPAPHYLPA